MLNSLNDFDSTEEIFVDTNIFLHHAFAANKNSIAFLKRAETRSLKLYTSTLVLEEMICKLMMQASSNFLDRVTTDRVKQFLQDEGNRQKMMESVGKYMEYIRTLQSICLQVLDFSEKDMRDAVRIISLYGLIPADAAHIAIMSRRKIRHLATSDRDFTVVEGITVWSPG